MRTLASRAWVMSLCAVLGACSDPAPSAPDAAVTDAVVVKDAAPWRCERSRAAAPVTVTRCNGSEALCARRYTDVAYATTHNAMSSAEDRFLGPNQMYGVPRQLRDGVRGLMLDAHPFEGDTWLCHGACQLGRKRLAEGLCDIGRYLDQDPGAVVTILFESYASAADVARAFGEAGLLDDVYAQRADAPWPTLGEMAAQNRRLVVFTDRDGGAMPWYHDVWRWAQETPFSTTAPGDLDCRTNRGDSGNPLFILNHFLTNPIGSRALAETVNHNPFLLDRARRCQRERVRLPNFVTVDFYDVGDVLATTAALNAGP